MPPVGFEPTISAGIQQIYDVLLSTVLGDVFSAWCTTGQLLCRAHYFWPQPRQLVPPVNFLDQVRTLPVMMMMMMMIRTDIIYVTYQEDMRALEANLHAFSFTVL